MRADARRNRERLLDAATALILELGTDPPLDAVARRAEVGIGTLYRHFPDRDALLHAVAELAMDRAIDAAETALATAAGGDEALRSYVHAAVDAGVGVLNLAHPLLGAPEWPDQRARMTTLLDDIVRAGKEAGRLRPDTTAADVVFPVIRFSRPVAIGLPHHEERALAHRHLDIYVDGLGTAPTDGAGWSRWSGQ